MTSSSCSTATATQNRALCIGDSWKRTGFESDRTGYAGTNRGGSDAVLEPNQKRVWYLAEERLQLGQSDDGGLDQNLAVVVVRALQAALQPLRKRTKGREIQRRGGGGRAGEGGRLTRSMLSSGLALLRMRMICLIWPWVTLLLMQPNTTRALGCSDGLYWKANLESQRETALPWQQGKVPSVLGKPPGYNRARRVPYFWASSVHWSNHLQAGMSLMQA